MSDRFVLVTHTSAPTKAQLVPEHWLTHPKLGDGLTPVAAAEVEHDKTVVEQATTKGRKASTERK